MAATSPPLPPPSSLALLLSLAPFVLFLLFLLLRLLSLHFKAQHKNNEAHEAQRSSHTPLEAACGVGEGEEEESERRKGEEKKRRKRGRKKRQGGEEAKDGAAAAPAAAGAAEEVVEGGDKRRREAAVGCPFPLSSFGSAMQRRIKSQYDELVKSSHAKVLTIAQMYKLEAEHKRLKEDAAVYNLVQEQLKLSPAYKTMLEISASMEKVPTEGTAELPDISFEELLAQEKKDSFWQRNGKLRSFPS